MSYLTHCVTIDRRIPSVHFRFRQHGLKKSQGLEVLAIQSQHASSAKLQIHEEGLIIPNASRCVIQQLVRGVDFTVEPEAGGQGSRRIGAVVQVLARSLASTEAPFHLQLESTLEYLLTVPALRPGVENSLRIAGGGFFTHRELRQTLDMNKASAVPAAGASSHELRPSVCFSFKTNVTPVTRMISL